MPQIALLKEYPDYAPVLAFWAFREWYMERAISFDLLIKAYKERVNDSNLPISLIAIEDKIPVGMISLKENDIWSRKDLNPWLSSLFVLPEYRRRGIGSLLIEHLIHRAKHLKYHTLFLFTECENGFLENYYAKKSWEFLEKAKGNDNNFIKIYNNNLS
ncbi:MAG: GNAT family N-acetyltransferase [Spirochaetota bacterium]